MLAERGSTSRLVLSFVNLSSAEFANKENTLLASQGPVSPLRSAPYGRRRRVRTVVTSWSGIAARRNRARASRTQLQLPPDNAQMPVTNSELSPAQAQRRLTLPRHLARPGYRSIDPRAVAAIDPLLEDIPLSYVQHTLERIGPQLLQVTRNSTATPPAGQLPRQLQIVCNDISMEPPSHVLAAYARVDSPRCSVTLFPAHALVLATTCAHLPILPASKPGTPAAAGASITLPVVPLRIPSPATFPTLLSYLYTKRADHLSTELLSLPLREETTSMDELARTHAASFTVKALIGEARKVHGLWSNAAALGIFDDKLFQTLEMVWEVLLSALAIGSGGTLEGGIEVPAE